jgi:hypothetical protein
VKTTLDISDSLFHDAKRYAEDNHLTFREVVEISLRRHLESAPSAPKFRLKKKTFHAKTLIDVNDWAAVRKLTYEGRGE